MIYFKNYYKEGVMEEINSKKILDKGNEFKKTMANQAILNTIYLIGCVLLFFVFLGDTLKTIVAIFNGVVEQKWSVITPTLVDLLVVGLSAKKAWELLNIIKDPKLFLIPNENSEITKDGVSSYIKNKQTETNIFSIFFIPVWYGVFVFIWDLITSKLSIFNEYTLQHMHFINALILVPIGVLLILYFPLVYANFKYREFLIKETNLTITDKEKQRQKEDFVWVKILKGATLGLLFLNLTLVGTFKLNSISVFEAINPIDNKQDLISKINSLECKQISFDSYHNTPTINIHYQTVDDNDKSYAITPALKEELQRATCKDLSK